MQRPQKRDREKQEAIGFQDPKYLTHDGFRVGTMLKDLGGYGAIDASMGQGNFPVLPYDVKVIIVNRIVLQIESNILVYFAIRSQQQGFVWLLTTANVQ